MTMAAGCGCRTLGKIIRGKWLMDGAATLSEAAARLEEEAARLRELERQGYRLAAPVGDDYGFLVRTKKGGKRRRKSGS
jgi:hypothetical protein